MWKKDRDKGGKESMLRVVQVMDFKISFEVEMQTREIWYRESRSDSFPEVPTRSGTHLRTHGWENWKSRKLQWEHAMTEFIIYKVEQFWWWQIQGVGVKQVLDQGGWEGPWRWGGWGHEKAMVKDGPPMRTWKSQDDGRTWSEKDKPGPKSQQQDRCGAWWLGVYKWQWHGGVELGIAIGLPAKKSRNFYIEWNTRSVGGLRGRGAWGKEEIISLQAQLKDLAVDKATETGVASLQDVPHWAPLLFGVHALPSCCSPGLVHRNGAVQQKGWLWLLGLGWKGYCSPCLGSPLGHSGDI